jgi:multidrug efflux pump subunit AcrA (membrane-fusion protein)
MKFFLVKLARIALPLLILVAGVAGFSVLSAQREIPVRAAEEKLPPLVETVRAEIHDGMLPINVDGLVIPYREIEVSAEVSGRIQRKAPVCRTGNFVTAGTVLLEIDRRDYDLEVRRLTRELEQADVMQKELEVEIANTQSQLQLAEQELALQRREVDRLKNLAERGVRTASEMEQAQRELLTVENTVLTPRNQLRLLETRRDRLESAKDLVSSQLDKAQLDLERTTIEAPVDGVIVRDPVEQGGHVQVGTLLLAIEDISAAEVRCSLRMEDLYWLWHQSGTEPTVAEGNRLGSEYQIPRTPVTVTYHLAGYEYNWDGVLSRFDGIGLDERTRTVPARVVVDEPRRVSVEGSTDSPGRPPGPPALVRGMYVTVTVHAQPQTQLLQIPERAVRPGNVVWYVRNSRLHVGQVRLAGIRHGQAIVEADRSDIIAGDAVVVSPVAQVTSGMEVREEPAS